MSENLLAINNLTVTVSEEGRERALVSHVSLEIPKQGVVGLVGGSGSGKTTTGLTILGLLPHALMVRQGEIFFEGRDLLKSSENDLQKIRGKKIGMVFQEPLNAFNPVFSIGYQIAEVLRIHSIGSEKERKARALEFLNVVGIQDPKRVAESFPHQLSGGMRQRAMIAQAIAAEPALLIADEPTSNLDVTLQAKIIELFEELRVKFKLSLLLITHDLGMVEHMADHIAVMREGEIVEQGSRQRIIQSPQHEYTHKLLKAFR